ncbi:RNA polymerase sigma factor [Brachybacterium rhamnosum]|uniref:RNA polymerase sigma factor n=1 Tax=Brachybacterium rhamnosum TaxID=173361 RepID=A0ABW4PTX9_9MICO|nr:DUF6596 domain-containing protein [Brachybacterium sp. SGAir0954]QCR52405.1 RNA polymerase subunit sigma-24 [Brachybacterium sp. SGAir0954]
MRGPTGAPADRAAVDRAVAAAHRDHWAAVLAATAGAVRDLDLAEDATAEAFAQALEQWARDGVPERPGAWLTVTARRRALDARRREQTLRRKLPLLLWDTGGGADGGAADGGTSDGDPRVIDESEVVVRDERLRLLFLCAHPALAPESRVALVLRLVLGLSTEEIAAAFLVPVPTMGARLTRAKRRIALSGIPCRVPEPEELPGRLTAVLDAISLVLAAGHTAPAGERHDRPDLVGEAVRLLELLKRLLPGQGEVHGLLAQALLVQARAGTRTDAEGLPVPLDAQDRTRWDRSAVDRADELVLDALRGGHRGPYLLQGAIAAARCVPERAEDVDGDEVVELYDHLLRHWPGPMVQLNRTVARARRGDDPTLLLAELDGVAEDLADYRPFHVARAELLRVAGREEESAAATQEALRCPGNAAEDALLRRGAGPSPLP